MTKVLRLEMQQHGFHNIQAAADQTSGGVWTLEVGGGQGKN